MQIPVFSLESLFSLLYPQQRFYFRVVREVYESYVLYCFSLLMANYLGDDEEVNRFLAEKFPSTAIKHTMPFCFLTPWKLNQEFLEHCRFGVVQHVVFRLLLALVTVLNYNGSLYAVGDYSPSQPFVWIVMANGSSQWYALYCLYLFYHVTKRKLARIKSLVKFIGIKVVMFFSWWQGLLITAMVNYGFIRRNRQFGAEDVGLQFEGLLVLMEMFLAACFFLYCFPVSDFNSSRGRGSEYGDSQNNNGGAWSGLLPARKSEQTSVLLLGIIPIRVNGSMARNCYWLYKWIMCVPSYMSVGNTANAGDVHDHGHSAAVSDDESNAQHDVAVSSSLLLEHNSLHTRGRRKTVTNSGEALSAGGTNMIDAECGNSVDPVIPTYLRDLDLDADVDMYTDGSGNGILRSLSSNSLGGTDAGDTIIGSTTGVTIDRVGATHSRSHSTGSDSGSTSGSGSGSGSLFYDYAHALLTFIDSGGVPEKPSPPSSPCSSVLPKQVQAARKGLRGQGETADIPEPEIELEHSKLASPTSTHQIRGQNQSLRVQTTQAQIAQMTQRQTHGQHQSTVTGSKYVYAKLSPLSSSSSSSASICRPSFDFSHPDLMIHNSTSSSSEIGRSSGDSEDDIFSNAHLLDVSSSSTAAGGDGDDGLEADCSSHIDVNRTPEKRSSYVSSALSSAITNPILSTPDAVANTDATDVLDVGMGMRTATYPETEANTPEPTSVWKAIYLSTVPLELGKDIKDLGKKVIDTGKAVASPRSYFRRHPRKQQQQQQQQTGSVSPTTTLQV